MKLIYTCTRCKKPTSIVNESLIGNKRFVLAACGHINVVDNAARVAGDKEIDPRLNDGRELYPFQASGVDFIRKSDFRCLITDEFGLGKTVQVVSALKNFSFLLPALAVVKASLKIQWVRELFNGAGIIAQILESDSEAIVDPRIQVYITSYDSLRTSAWKNTLEFKTLILDECQMVKNHDSKRTQEVRNLAKDRKYIIATSGTPIKNNAGEYFPILNLLRPGLFGNQVNFIQQHTNSYRSNYGMGWKVGGLRNPKSFKELTKDFIIRRERKEVLPDLPAIRRSYRYTSMNIELAKKYKAISNDLQDYLMNQDESDEMDRATHILAYMNKLRHLTGYAKVDSVLDYIDEFLTSEEVTEKIVIFHHHKDIGEILKLKLTEMGIATLQLKAEQDSLKRSEIIDEFRSSGAARVLLAPTLACGEGINLQFCSHAIIMEREWSPVSEEQAEGRFSRPGSTADSVEIVYPVAVGSIDEMYAEVVERKRQHIKEALSGNHGDTWQQSTIIRELSDLLIREEKQPFRLN